MTIAVLVDKEIMLGGRRAWVREMEITEPVANERFGVGDSYCPSLFPQSTPTRSPKR